MKKIILIGASGFVGSAILNEAISRDYKVTAVVRNPEKIAIKNDNLTVVKADVSSAETVDELCKGFDTVISAYNPGWQIRISITKPFRYMLQFLKVQKLRV